MLTWSTTSASQNFLNDRNKKQNRSKTDSRAAEEFLDAWDAAVFEEKTIGDPELDEEAKLWRSKFAHLRVVGHNCESTDGEKKNRRSDNASKSAHTIQEKSPVAAREFSLPRIDGGKKKV